MKEIVVILYRKNHGKSILACFFGLFQLGESSESLPDLVEELEQAWWDWKRARLYFDNVTDPDLIDFAIFNMGASEKKYIYLLKQARETGLSIEDFEYGLGGRIHDRAYRKALV